MTSIQRALISVSDKSGLIELAQALSDLGVVILSTGGTAQHLRDHHIAVTDVADVTHFPEIMGGRVKTLHPMIHGGILARRGEDDVALAEHHIDMIDMVVCNLYPFEKTIADPQTSLNDAIEKIDIGGPSMLRSAAKNFKSVTAICNPSDYPAIISELKANYGATSMDTRKRLAQKVFAEVARYNCAISAYLNDEIAPTTLQKKEDLRYGENPHQEACLYQNLPVETNTLANAKQHQGKPLSFNNLIDTDAAWRGVQAMDEHTPACVIVKHATPCGVACADTQMAAYSKAFACDSSSAFGGIIALNLPLDLDAAKLMISQQFIEVIIAPSFSDDVLNVLSAKKNLRVLACTPKRCTRARSHHSISGGMLIQDVDTRIITDSDLVVATKRAPTPQERRDCLFAWQVVKYVKSNAIVYAKDYATLGIGSGQTSRVFSAEIAVLKAAHAELTLEGAVMASDAFFPFADGIQIAIDAGITAIIQPGGSIRDQEVIDAADAAGIAMLFTATRHFRH